MNKAKDEALRALTHLKAQLDGDAPLGGLEKHTLKATVHYAYEQVLAIQEVKRQRKAPAGEVASE